MNPTDKPTDQTQVPQGGQIPNVPLTEVPGGPVVPPVNSDPAPVQTPTPSAPAAPVAPSEPAAPAAPVVPDPNNPAGGTTPPVVPGV